jgi:hypothetical protein
MIRFNWVIFIVPFIMIAGCVKKHETLSDVLKKYNPNYDSLYADSYWERDTFLHVSVDSLSKFTCRNDVGPILSLYRCKVLVIAKQNRVDSFILVGEDAILYRKQYFIKEGKYRQ